MIVELLDPKINADLERLTYLTKEAGITIIDLFDSQLRELEKVLMFDFEVQNEIKTNRSLGKSIDTFVYYPWRKTVVRILNEPLFVRLRTARNVYKITIEEQEVLSKKCIGIIGLSVGSNLALSLAQERICGHFKIADFDVLETSNLNRIQAGLFEVGISKSNIVYRQILELDPYLKVELFPQGISPSNIDQFLLGGNAIDLLAEECDDLEVKLLSRQKSKVFSIPVVMETSDRGLIDVERFDLDNQYPILHGRIDEAELSSISDKATRRMKLLESFIDFSLISERGKLSMSEIGKTITSWPQLGTDVRVGSGIAASLIRQILLGHHKISGRWYVDHMNFLQSNHKNI
jgi:molybdopterin/thiamine biosynthesis adenylyltransferase